MITSKADVVLFVWVWLPNAKQPVVAGRLQVSAKGYEFIYGRGYLARNDAFSLDPHDLPLKATHFGPQSSLFNALRDAAPDAWGRRVLLYRTQKTTLTELDYLLHGGDPRIGALHFQTTAETYCPPKTSHATLEELYQAAEAVETGQWTQTAWIDALQHGTSIGGARPKALFSEWIAKFSMRTDTFPVVRQEALGMTLARYAGLDVAEHHLRRVLGRDMLLVRRFDYPHHRHMISGLTVSQLDEMEARYASYPDLAAFLWKYANNSHAACEALYRRMVLNVLIGNTDDHARNHAFFWDGAHATLTPAYDVSVFSRVGQTASQAMIIGKQGSYAARSNLLSACDAFGLDLHQANHIIDELVVCIHTHWKDACDLAELTQIERDQLLGRAVLSPEMLAN